jgi:hypothetical protein
LRTPGVVSVMRGGAEVIDVDDVGLVTVRESIVGASDVDTDGGVSGRNTLEVDADARRLAKLRAASSARVVELLRRLRRSCDADADDEGSSPSALSAVRARGSGRGDGFQGSSNMWEGSSLRRRIPCAST